MKFNKIVLDNGLRILTIPKPDSPSVTAMVLVGVGSRHEPSELAGIAHFIEHNVFKGTKNRPRRNQISEEIEGLGGITNASTGHDYTYYWAKAAASQAEKILNVIMDISLNMTFPPKDLEIERGNVIEEINMYHDNPQARLQWDFFEFVWGGHPVGRKIIGVKKTIRNLSREQMLEFVRQNYRPERMLVVVAGSFDKERVEAQVTDYYALIKGSILKGAAERFEEFQKEARVYLDADDTQQTHLALGVKTFGRGDSRRFALDLMNTVLGKGMSSRLFRRIRDELGLAYYVGSVNYEFEETGIWLARAGVQNERVIEAVQAVLEEFEKLTQEKVGAGELRKAKEYVKGKTLLGVETSEDLGSWYGFQELLEKEVLSPLEYNERIEEVGAEEVRGAAQDLWRGERLNLGLVGPHQGKEERFREILGGG